MLGEWAQFLKFRFRTCMYAAGFALLLGNVAFSGQDKKPPEKRETPPKKEDDTPPKKDDDDRSIKREGTPDVMLLNKDDEGMKKAIETARKTLPNFITALKKEMPTGEGFSLKKAFLDSKKVEHLWIGEITYDGKKFKGVVQNEPLEIKNIEMGKEVEILPNEITDWMFIEEETLQGGYSIRLLRARMTPEQRKKFDKEFPYKIVEEK